MSYNGFAIDQYLDAADVTKQLDELIKKPVYSIRKDKLKEYETEYFDKKCARSKEMITKAREVIPGGVQLLSKRPEMFIPGQWPAYATRGKGCQVWDMDGKRYYDMTTNGIGACLLGYADPDVSAAASQ